MLGQEERTKRHYTLYTSIVVKLHVPGDCDGSIARVLYTEPCITVDRVTIVLALRRAFVSMLCCSAGQSPFQHPLVAYL